MVHTTWKLIALAALSAAVVAAAASPAVGQDRRLTAAKALEVSLLAEVNEVRRANGVPALRVIANLGCLDPVALENLRTTLRASRAGKRVHAERSVANSPAAYLRTCLFSLP